MKYFVFALLIAFAAGAKAQNYTTPVTGLAYPVAFAFTPDGRIFVTEKEGRIKVFAIDGTAMGTLYNLSDSTDTYGELGLLGIEVDPSFSLNHYVYVYYIHRYPALDTLNTTNRHIRVVRFTENNNVGSNPTILLDIAPGNMAANHVGGNLHFSPTDLNNIYISIGEITVQANAQTLTNPFGKILRIGKDGSIPIDNPFYDDGDVAVGVDDRIWTYGHRNPFDFCFSPGGILYSTENGANAFDELNMIISGNNYGWPGCEGNYEQNSTVNPCNNSNFVGPMETWAAPVPALTGVMWYSNSLFPDLNNHLLVSDFNNGYLYNLTLGNAPLFDTVLTRTVILDLPSLTTLREGPDGFIYALSGVSGTNGVIYKISSPTGMQENAVIRTIKVYPNPANDMLLVDLKGMPAHTTEIYNNIGGMVMSHAVNGKELAEIDIATLPVGSYFVRILGKEGVIGTVKFIRE